MDQLDALQGAGELGFNSNQLRLMDETRFTDGEDSYRFNSNQLRLMVAAALASAQSSKEFQFQSAAINGQPGGAPSTPPPGFNSNQLRLMVHLSR